MNPYEIVHSVVVTEKATELTDELNQYVFKVEKKADKKQVRSAVEAIFDVTVDSVRTMNKMGKRKRLRYARYGKRPDWKKAIVTLSEGEIDII
ncbi:MAG: 50S ribosomal protein L23 [Lentisphaeria bacterium]